MKIKFDNKRLVILPLIGGLMLVLMLAFTLNSIAMTLYAFLLGASTLLITQIFTKILQKNGDVFGVGFLSIYNLGLVWNENPTIKFFTILVSILTAMILIIISYYIYDLIE